MQPKKLSWRGFIKVAAIGGGALVVVGITRNRFARESEGERNRLNYLCPSYKTFFHHIDQPMRIMADLLRRGRAPAEIMPRM